MLDERVDVAVCAVVGERGDPGADRHGLREERELVQTEVFLDPLDPRDRVRGRRRDDEGELVAAEPVAVAGSDLLDPAGEQRQQRVAHRVSVAVVDVLEVVDVDQAERQVAAVGNGGHRPRRLFVERAAVLERGQPVGRGLRLGDPAADMRALVHRQREQGRHSGAGRATCSASRR